MFIRYNFNNINISLKKIKKFSYSILKFSNYFFEILTYLNFYFNKSSIVLRKIFYYILCDLKIKNKNFFKFFIKSFIIQKSGSYKRLNYRARGKFDLVLKKFCNIFLILYNN